MQQTYEPSKDHSKTLSRLAMNRVYTMMKVNRRYYQSLIIEGEFVGKVCGWFARQHPASMIVESA